eukprot:g6265.t1
MELHGRDPVECLQPYQIVRTAQRHARERMDVDESDLDTEDERERFQTGLESMTKKSRIRRKKMLKESTSSEQQELISKLEADAHLAFAGNRAEEGERICREVIRLGPNNADIYQTLASIIEQSGRFRKALDYYMIAAHLAPRKIELWKQLANSSVEAGLNRQAIYCLTHILRLDKNDMETRIDRALLYAEVGENRRACEAFEKINEAKPGDFEVVKMLAKLYHRMDRPQKAIEALENAILRYEDQIDFSVVNVLVDLYLQQGSYSEAAALISRSEGSLRYGQTLPIDLRVKLGLCALHTADYDTAYVQFGDLLKEPVEECVDLYLQAGDALLGVHKYHQALNLFEQLIPTNENKPSLWNRITKCKELSEGRSSVIGWWIQLVDGMDYSHANYVEAALSAIQGLVDLGDMDHAEERMKSLNELLQSDQVDFPEEQEAATSALLLKESLDLQIGKKESFLERMLPIVYLTLKKMRQDYKISEEIIQDLSISPELLDVPTRIRRAGPNHTQAMDAGREREAVFAGFRSIRQELRYARKERIASSGDVESQDDDSPLLLEDFIKGGEQFTVFMKVVDELITEDRLADAEYLLGSAVDLCKKIARGSRPTIRDAFRIKLVDVMYKQRKYAAAMCVVKLLCTHWPYSIKVWNLYSLLLGKIGKTKWVSKYITSFRKKYPTSVPVIIISGQIFALSGQFEMAMGEFNEAMKICPETPLIWLSLGVTKINKASVESSSSSRWMDTLQGFALLQEYQKRRGNVQESTYNMGRAAHQLGMKALAVEFYKKALEVEPSDSKFDLRRETAYNLILIYKESGAIPLAREVTLYVCGITAYDLSHLGHARAYVAFDLLFRFLSGIGYDVYYVRNYTDIDDKIIKRAKESQETESSLSARFIDEFTTDMDLLGCKRPNAEPRATAYIPQMIEIIQSIIQNGHGYEVEGDVFFDTRSINNYGRLSKRNLEDNRPGERVSIDLRKKHPNDFALWKSAKEGEPSWSSPWGQGRPGWHIECSAMIKQLIGSVVDIHGGGSDLVFPHHENELIQSQAAASPCDREVMVNGGTDFVKYWVHNGFVNINDEKMSKSLGNFLTIRDVLKEHHPLTLRWMLLSIQYRQPLNFSDEIMEQSASIVYYLYQTLLDAKSVAENVQSDHELTLMNLYETSSLVKEVVNQLCDDLNTTVALAAIQQHLKIINELLHTKKGRKTPNRVQQLSDGCRDIECCLKLIGFQTDNPDSILTEMKNLTLQRAKMSETQVMDIIEARNKARIDKNYEKADAIRKELNQVGIAICDSPQGTTWRPI